MENLEIPFSFSWKAMQLLGKSLYSNAWSAISELVANGFDAKAKTVYVMIDGRDKSNAHIEIMDSGIGMDFESIHTYAKVGYDRRAAEGSENPDAELDMVMGRKGIGKLAALYLSDDYFIQSKSEGITTTWRISHDDNPESIPCLEQISSETDMIGNPVWGKAKSGTIIVMEGVDLIGLGDAAYNALSSKLANQFLLSSMNDKQIALSIQRKQNDSVAFKPVKKNIAFGNMVFIASKFEKTANIPVDIARIEDAASPQHVQMALPGKTSELVSIQTTPFSLEELAGEDAPVTGDYYAPAQFITNIELLGQRTDVRAQDDMVAIPYRLTGWIGVHASINKAIAGKNDARFTKNNFYNPAQIRLYVRNKLACEDVLTKLNITQAFANYIEGEISFDLLDENLLPDIATSSRQGFDELDDRWNLLKKILRPIVRNLIGKRQKLIDDLNAQLKKRQASAKAQATREIKQELKHIPNMSTDEQTDLANRITMKFQGNINLEAKEDYKVFISHTSRDSHLTNFCYKLLEARGAQPREFFYTSADDDFERYRNPEALPIQIKNNIISDNTLIAYFTSPYFRKSEYCLFEGGAGWATRTENDYLILSTTYDGIPPYLTDGRPEKTLACGDDIPLDRTNYHHLISFLNSMIGHLNVGRRIKNMDEISPLPEPQIPDDVQLNAEGKTVRDYMDPTFLDYWDEYVAKCTDYLVHPMENPPNPAESTND